MCNFFRLLSQVSFLFSVCVCWCSSTILEKILSKKVRFSPSVNASIFGSPTATTFRFVCSIFSSSFFLNRFYYPNSQDFCDFEKIIFRKYDNFCRIHKKGIEKGRNTTVKFRTSPLKCRLRPCYSRV